MLVKIFGGIDLISGLLLMFSSGFSLPMQVSILFGIVLIAKSAMGLWRDFASWCDIIGGIFFLLLIFFSIPWFLCVIAGILVLQKGIFSFLG